MWELQHVTVTECDGMGSLLHFVRAVPWLPSFRIKLPFCYLGLMSILTKTICDNCYRLLVIELLLRL